MSVKTLTHTFSTVTGSGGDASTNLTIDADNIAILFVKVEPSVMGGTADFDIFQKDTLLSADISYRATAFTGDHIDPIENISGVETERTEGFVTAYQDDDASKELHIKITNNDTSTKDFDITIRYLSAGDLTSTGTPANNQVAVWTDVDTLEGDANLTWDGSILLIDVGDIRVDGFIRTSGGTAGAPAVTPSNDSDTGLFFTANKIHFAAFGVEQASIDVNKFAVSNQFVLTDINTETLSADKVIAANDPMIHFLDPGGANRNVDLMPEVAGQIVIIVNTADMGSEDLIVREDAGVTTIVTLTQNEMAFLTCNGTVWKGMVGANT